MFVGREEQLKDLGALLRYSLIVHCVPMLAYCILALQFFSAIVNSTR